MTVFRHSSESAAQTTLGNTTKDIAYVLVSGIDQVDFGNKSMNACLKGGKKLVKNMSHLIWLITNDSKRCIKMTNNLAMVGYMLPSSGYDATKDYTCIAGESKIHH